MSFSQDTLASAGFRARNSSFEGRRQEREGENWAELGILSFIGTDWVNISIYLEKGRDILQNIGGFELQQPDDGKECLAWRSAQKRRVVARSYFLSKCGNACQISSSNPYAERIPLNNTTRLVIETKRTLSGSKNWHVLYVSVHLFPFSSIEAYFQKWQR